MATQQKRMLTSDKSKLKDVKISDLLVSPLTLTRKEDEKGTTLSDQLPFSQNVLATPAAWTALPLPVRQHLYTLLPPPEPHEPAHDPEINPMQTAYRPYIEEELSQWQADLGNGFETKKWRDDAIRASQERLEGKGWGEGGRGWEGRGRGDGGREGRTGIGVRGQVHPMPGYECLRCLDIGQVLLVVESA
ncbi:hypothetical protein KC367_g151 [Hortaea werneckii]|nr:hypothetical protein KC367_g151 [Hortaea werneckii]